MRIALKNKVNKFNSESVEFPRTKVDLANRSRRLNLINMQPQFYFKNDRTFIISFKIIKRLAILQRFLGK